MGSGFGFFDFEPGPCSDLPELLTRLATKARQTVGPIDGIVLPECAINESDYEKCARAALAESKFLVCGVKGSGAGTFPSNRVRFAIRIGPDVSETDQELVIGELDPQSRSPILPDDGGTYTASDSDRNSGAPGTIAARSTPPRYTAPVVGGRANEVQKVDPVRKEYRPSMRVLALPEVEQGGRLHGPAVSRHLR
jgi:hypothetical protein